MITSRHWLLWMVVAGALLVVGWIFSGYGNAAAAEPATLAPQPAAVSNGEFECPAGYFLDNLGRRVPTGWILARAGGEPEINSARHQYAGSCENDGGHVERMGGRDALSIRAKDMETPPAPGKPFDVVLYQQVAVAPGGDYSVSGWMLSLCGGSAVPSDCPAGVYVRKAIGLDPTGGTDPDAETIVWTENLDNFVTAQQERIGWSNLRVGARAQSATMTVFLRIHSPFQWHGNHAFVDSVHFARAPVGWFVDLARRAPAGATVPVRWASLQSPEIAAIPGGTHEVLVDVQTRQRQADGTVGPWQDWVRAGAPSGECWLTVGTAGTRHDVRLRVRAEQPPPPAPGAWPNQRFPGPWSLSQTITARAVSPRAQIPAAAMSVQNAAVHNLEPNQLGGLLFFPSLGRGLRGC